MSCVRYWRSRSRPFSDCKSALLRVRSDAEPGGDAQAFAWVQLPLHLMRDMEPSRVCEDLVRLRVPADGGQRERFTGICGRRGNPINVGVELGVRRTPSDRRTNQTARTVSHRGRQRRRPIVGRPSSDYGCLDAGQWPSIVSPTAASSYPEVCLCALR